MKLSVVVCVRNEEDRLRDCLESVYKNKPDEVILVDGNSSDKTIEIARQFPGICNCTTIDWFHPWPKNALVSVATEYLKDLVINGGDEDIKSNVPDHMAEVHLAVTQASLEYQRRSRRHKLRPRHHLYRARAR